MYFKIFFFFFQDPLLFHVIELQITIIDPLLIYSYLKSMVEIICVVYFLFGYEIICLQIDFVLFMWDNLLF